MDNYLERLKEIVDDDEKFYGLLNEYVDYCVYHDLTEDAGIILRLSRMAKKHGKNPDETVTEAILQLFIDLTEAGRIELYLDGERVKVEPSYKESFYLWKSNSHKLAITDQRYKHRFHDEYFESTNPVARKLRLMSEWGYDEERAALMEAANEIDRLGMELAQRKRQSD